MNKRYYKIVLLIITSLAICFSQVSFAQNAKKDVKSTLKQLKKEGFTMETGTKDPKTVIAKFNEKLEEMGSVFILGTASNCKSTNICKQSALNSAQNQLIRYVSGKVQGQIGTIMKHNSNNTDEEIDKMVGSIINNISADISGCLINGFSAYKEHKDGSKEYRCYYIVNKKQIIQNLKYSLKETKMTIEEVESISNFVKDSLDEME